jgi:uncharacterized protein (UPF0276 family)
MPNTAPHTERPYLGFGLGLRPAHYETILNESPAVDWFEIISENYLIPGGKPIHYLERIRARYPLVMHGVSLSIGSLDPLDREYLRQLKALADRIEPAWLSDHLCWTGVGGVNTHDLLPLPYTEEAINHVVARLSEVQDFLGRRILIENVSSYVTYPESEMTEWEFLREIVERADCGSCSISTISTSAASITNSTRAPTSTPSRSSGCGSFISPDTATTAITLSTPMTSR